MNFCSNCGSDKLIVKIPENDHRLRTVCEDCNYIFYENPQIVVGTIPIYNGKVLLAKRGIEPQKGKWNLPAGFLERGESIENGALRETEEETNCSVKDVKLFSIYYSLSNHLYIFYLANLKSDKFDINFESPEISFFNKEDIPWENIAFESNTHALKSFFDKIEASDEIHFQTEKF